MAHDFAWIYVATALSTLRTRCSHGNYRQTLFVPKDLAGVRPMIRHYFFFRRKPAQTEVYNPLQKMAYTSAIFLGLLSVLTGIVLKSRAISLLVACWEAFIGAAVAFFVFSAHCCCSSWGTRHGGPTTDGTISPSMLTGWKTQPGILALTIVHILARSDANRDWSEAEADGVSRSDPAGKRKPR